MSTMQAYSCANATILHSQHHPQARFNRGYVGLSPPKAFSTAGYCCRTEIWPFWSQLWHPGLCSNAFTPITFAIGKGKSFKAGGRKHQENRKNSLQKKDKGNVWSLDNEYTVSDANKDLGKKRKGKRVSKSGRSKGPPLRILVSAAMPVETEKVLQTQEPVIKPVWSTFASSISGIWKGVGAAFSPLTAEMEPLSLGKKNEYLYDCYTLSKIEAVGSPAEGSNNKIWRKINWVVANPLGEQGQGKVAIQDDLIETEEKTYEPKDKIIDANGTSSQDKADKVHIAEEKQHSCVYETKALPSSDVMEDDFMDLEPGLVFFEDGSYSRGPLKLPVGGNLDNSNYFISPTYKIEQCLVRGSHKRLRAVHTIAVKGGGAEVQLMRLVLYEEEWMGPIHSKYMGETEESSLKPLSQRKRIPPAVLAGAWKVFEISATAILEEDIGEAAAEKRPSYVYLCMETVKRRSLPEVPVHFVDEDALDMQDATVLWLPDGVTAYVDTKEDGILSIGVGWYSDDGTNLVMERDYGADGKLLEVHSKSEVKRRWSVDYM